MEGFLDPTQNVERIRQLPFTVPAILLASIGIVGNAHALHILRKYYGIKSSFTIILTYLAAFDLVSCINMLMKEVMERLQTPVNFRSPVAATICSGGNFFGFVFSMLSMWLVLLISYDRYRAICFPFSMSLSKKKIHILCLGMGCLSVCSSVPVAFIYGIRSFSLPTYQNGTECGIKDSLRSSFMPTIYFAVLWVAFVAVCLLVARFYYKIWRAVREAQKTKRTLMEGMDVRNKYVAKDSTQKKADVDEIKESWANKDIEEPVTNINRRNIMPDDLIKDNGSQADSLKRRNEEHELAYIDHPDKEVEARHEKYGYNKKVTTDGAKIFTVPRGEDRQLQTVCTGQHAELEKHQKATAKDESSSKLTRTALIITIVFFVCYTTALVSLSIQARPSTEVHITHVKLMAFRCLINVTFLNNIFNPAVYFLTDPRFRSGLRQMYKCK